MERKEYKLPSGAVLKIQVAPFSDAKALYQTLLKELKRVKIDSNQDVGSVLKNMFCLGFSSPEIDAKLEKCFERCTINDLRIDKDTFESVERRGDYIYVCAQVLRANIDPFGNSLYAEYKRAIETIGNIHA